MCQTPIRVMLVAGVVAGALSMPLAARQDRSVLRLATTTSTQDSGLLGAILPAFEKANRCRVDVVAVGTGQALEIGRRGDADVLLVHDRKAEDRFVAERHAVERFDVMYNDFVIVGPLADPAKISGMSRASDAFGAIAAARAQFVSRGDKSGTHAAELAIWTSVNVSPSGAWYRSVGQGMGETLVMADEQRAYVLADRGTWLSMQAKLPALKILVGGRTLAENRDSSLRNRYGVMAVSARTHPGVNASLAARFVDWLLSADTQKAIGEFGVKTHGQPLFYPDSEELKTTRDVTVKVGSGTRRFTIADLQALPKASLKDYGPVGVKIGPVPAHTWAGALLKDVLLRTDAAVGGARFAGSRIVVTSRDGWTATVLWDELFGALPRGAALYNVKGCNECHGAQAQGSAPAGKRPAPALAGRAWAADRTLTLLRSGGAAHAGLNPYTEAQLPRADLQLMLTWLASPSTRPAKADVFHAAPGRQAVLLAYEKDGRAMTGRDGLIQLVVGPDEFAGRYSHWVKTVDVVPPTR